jgi:hypothetical protein
MEQVQQIGDWKLKMPLSSHDNLQQLMDDPKSTAFALPPSRFVDAPAGTPAAAASSAAQAKQQHPGVIRFTNKAIEVHVHQSNVGDIQLPERPARVEAKPRQAAASSSSKAQQQKKGQKRGRNTGSQPASDESAEDESSSGSESNSSFGSDSSGGVAVYQAAASSKHTMATRKRGDTIASSSQAAAVDALPCKVCNSGDGEMVLCDYSAAHEADSVAYHPVCAKLGAIPAGKWKCPECIAAEASQGKYDIEAILFKRQARALLHTARCIEAAGGKCRWASSHHIAITCHNRGWGCTSRCSRAKPAVRYYVKWVGCDADADNRWEPATNVIDSVPILKRDFESQHKGQSYCKTCKCVPCLCGQSNSQQILGKW